MEAQKFDPGSVFFWPGARKALPEEVLQSCLARHAHGDWGDVTPAVKEENDQALKDGWTLLLSGYPVNGHRLTIISEIFCGHPITTVALTSELGGKEAS